MMEPDQRPETNMTSHQLKVSSLGIGDHDEIDEEQKMEEEQLVEHMTEVSLTEMDASTEMMMERYLQLKIPESYEVQFDFSPER